MNDFITVKAAKNGFIVERMYWPKGSAYQVIDSHVAKTPAEVIKLVTQTMKCFNK